MLSLGQIELLVHLKKFSVANQAACLRVLDTGKTQQEEKLLYSLRPLVKNKYISRRKDGLYSLLGAGQEWTEHIQPLLKSGGDCHGRKRVNQVSHMAALLGWYGIPTAAVYPSEGQNCFIPSAIWRTVRSGLISTTRFLGILFYRGMRLAVYNIGDGNYEWQSWAECSLHFHHYGTRETRATGILLVCDDGLGIELGKKIVRNTLRHRDRLLRSWHTRRESDKRCPYATTTPVRVRAEYQHAYLAEQSQIMEILNRAAVGRTIFRNMHQRLGVPLPRLIEEYVHRKPERHYINISQDLLALAFFCKIVQEYEEFQKMGLPLYACEHHLHLPEKCAEWGTFLKLPHENHILSEGEIAWLTTSN